MINSEQLVNAFAVNLNIIKRQTEGLTHQDSLLQPPVRGNCLNWVLGHIAVNRNRTLRALGQEPVLTEAETARYITDSEPVTENDKGVLALEKLLDALERAQDGIALGLERATPTDLATEIEVGQRTMTVGQRLFGLYFHETYHTGQTELLRQLAGTDDKVI
jgi:uncharacterized damage-inducible protein DinB